MTQIRNRLFAIGLMLLMTMPILAQDPGASLGTCLQTMFTGPLDRAGNRCKSLLVSRCIAVEHR
jgi:hypothetical protein